MTLPLWAQEEVPVAQPRAGFQVTNVSAYAGYYSSGLPTNGGAPLTGVSNAAYDVNGGGSVEFDWMKFTDRSTVAFSYTPSYTEDMRYSSLSGLNQKLSLNVSRKLAPRWTYQFTLAGIYSNLPQTFFAPTNLTNLAAVPATFTDLADALLNGKFAANPLLGVALTNAPLPVSPLNSLIYGVRTLTTSGGTSLSYSFSPRLSLTFNGNASRNQQMSTNLAAGGAYLIPDTTLVGASVSLSYSLSPVTQIGASVTSVRTVSAFVDSYTTTSVATLGRSFRQRWIMQVHGGVGKTNLVRQTGLGVAVPTEPRPVFGGSLAYKTLSSTFLGSYDRTTVDNYGLGASTTSTSTGTWHWRRPSSLWWLDSSFTWQQLSGNAQANTSGWQVTGSLSRALGRHTILVSEYAYMNYSGGVYPAAYHFSENAVRLMVTWIAHPVVP